MAAAWPMITKRLDLHRLQVTRRDPTFRHDRLRRHRRNKTLSEETLMERHETIFHIGYSVRIETMQAMLLARIDRFINLSLLFLGAAVVTSAAPVITGLSVAFFGAVSFVYQLGSNSTRSLIQKQKYEALLASADELEDRDLHRRYVALQEGDCLVLGSLKIPAYIAELVARGDAVPADCRMSRFEKMMAFVAGGLPKASDYQSTSSSQP